MEREAVSSLVQVVPREADPRIILVRHGQTQWSVEGRHTGLTDVGLTPHGEEEARGLGIRLAGRRFGLALVSPLQRARETARAAGIDAEIDPRLVEWDYGAYEGLTSAQIVEQIGTPWNLWFDGVPRGSTPGESAGDLRARTSLVLERVRPVIEAGEDVVIVAHGHVLRALAASWTALPPEAGATLSLATASLSELGLEHGHPVIKNWNC